jgi:hypothetical protein
MPTPATDIRIVTLAGREFPVPPLPLRAAQVVYPLCRKLSFAANPADPEGRSFVDRFVTSGGALDCIGDDFADLLDVIFHAINAGGAGLSRDEFEALPAKPLELTDAFFAIRYQTGGWVEMPATPASPSGDETGEPKRAPRPRTNRRRT